MAEGGVLYNAVRKEKIPVSVLRARFEAKMHKMEVRAQLQATRDELLQATDRSSLVRRITCQSI
jgi:hypothetical protein